MLLIRSLRQVKFVTSSTPTRHIVILFIASILFSNVSGVKTLSFENTWMLLRIKGMSCLSGWTHCDMRRHTAHQPVTEAWAQEIALNESKCEYTCHARCCEPKSGIHYAWVEIWLYEMYADGSHHIRHLFPTPVECQLVCAVEGGCVIHMLIAIDFIRIALPRMTHATTCGMAASLLNMDCDGNSHGVCRHSWNLSIHPAILVSLFHYMNGFHRMNDAGRIFNHSIDTILFCRHTWFHQSLNRLWPLRKQMPTKFSDFAGSEFDSLIFKCDRCLPSNARIWSTRLYSSVGNGVLILWNRKSGDKFTWPSNFS